MGKLGLKQSAYGPATTALVDAFEIFLSNYLTEMYDTLFELSLDSLETKVLNFSDDNYRNKFDLMFSDLFNTYLDVLQDERTFPAALQKLMVSMPEGTEVLGLDFEGEPDNHALLMKYMLDYAAIFLPLQTSALVLKLSKVTTNQTQVQRRIQNRRSRPHTLLVLLGRPQRAG